MITGVGIDLIEVERVAVKIRKETGFRELVFSKKEIAYCEKKTNKFEHYAARFAAKEAFLKALKTGWRGKITWHDIEVVNDADGVPSLNVSGEAAVLLKGLTVDIAHLSISHTTEHATAHVIFERR